jgi:hypothetical protein
VLRYFGHQWIQVNTERRGWQLGHYRLLMYYVAGLTCLYKIAVWAIATYHP